MKSTKKHLAVVDALESQGFEFLGFNQFIRSGYRVHHTWHDCWLSLFQLHNETWNVWSHLVGAVVFFGLSLHHTWLEVADNASVMPASLIGHALPLHLRLGLHTPSLTSSVNFTSIVQIPPASFYVTHAQHVPTWPVVAYTAGVCVCFTCSAIYHLLYIQSRAWCAWFTQVDYAGIIVLIASAFVPMLSYAFYCDRDVATMYLSVVGSLAMSSLVASFAPAFQDHPHIRTGVFLALAGFGFVPIGHLMRHHGLFHDHVLLTLHGLAGTAVVNLVGVALYVTQFPERSFPGRFDLVGSSHQWWHVCVFTAALVYYAYAVQHFEWRCLTPCL
ncbi:hypothetical protein DYB37_006365 [Aphanomyces astaci]|uniref:Uncharacterized protein n=1 Tax=Aphanomyces astaci TaxID=112090 RepID=A0A397DFH1_APHAT|nr:hypothetical protein DYB34_005608 [Aphanomyces astaci]RHY64363.1 hypothetical protein DYB30_005763 [Aphanomyces astaci]RHY92055.1 hypothetical protein DYB35_005811 [Aphanomyces astaci]RHZ22600.1 hypothetical protein DYB37_006365 [Aphanomyces astaci]